MNYNKKEEALNALTHGVGVVLAIIGLFYLIDISSNSAIAITSCVVYASTLIILYLASTIYHSVIGYRWKKVFKTIDHLSIYLLIAGSYTPFCILGLKGTWGISLLCIIWSLALFGFVFKLSKWSDNEKVSLALYALMGWLAIIAIYPMVQNLTSNQILFLFLGGLSYTLGIYFYVKNKIPYNHAIWHLFVLAGSILHYVFVVDLI